MVVIDNTKLNIFPRLAVDVIRLAQLSRSRTEQPDEAAMLFDYCYILHSSLKRNVENLPWYRFLLRRKILRITMPNVLVLKLPVQTISDLVLKVFTAEGLSPAEVEGMKKKASATN